MLLLAKTSTSPVSLYIYPNTLSALAVLINGNATADWDRLKSVDFSDTRVDFRFIGVSSSEDGTTFQCRNNENGQLSDILKLNVYCKYIIANRYYIHTVIL